MNTLLLCDRPPGETGCFSSRAPLALVPVCGRTLLDRALEQISREKGGEVLVLAADRPHLVREGLANGSHWGMKVRFQSLDRPLDAEVARLRFWSEFQESGEMAVRRLTESGWLLPAAMETASFPGRGAIAKLLRDHEAPSMVTMREVTPGVRVSTRASVHPAATITAPAWIGPSAKVAAGAMVGPDAIVETGAFIDQGARVASAWIGPDTYVGRGAELTGKLAWGARVESEEPGASVEVDDAFILADLRRNPIASPFGILSRLGALVLLATTTPLALIWLAGRALRGLPLFDRREVILPRPQSPARSREAVMLRSLAGAGVLPSRWPELFVVLRGHMRLVGNRPVAAESLAKLAAVQRRLWTQGPAGLFSLADAEGLEGDRVEAARIHAAWFAAHPSWRLGLSILGRCLRRLVLDSPTFSETRINHPHTTRP
jgi:hypothetical protein